MSSAFIPDSTAVRVALWRTLHLEVDQKPHVFEDSLALKLVSPPENWRERPDMHPIGTARFRASIVARARFLEDTVEQELHSGIGQYVLLGAGLDTFAQRRPLLAKRLQIYEVEKGDTLAWKKERLQELGFQIPNNVHYVSVNFEDRSSWWQKLVDAGLDLSKPSLVASMGVSMYLTLEGIKETLAQLAKLPPGSKLVMTFLLPLELVAPEDRAGFEMSIKGARNSGTPFLSFFSHEQMKALATEAGFKNIEIYSTSSLPVDHFCKRNDGLKPSTGEEILIATI